MTVIAEPQEIGIHPVTARRNELRVERQDISFDDMPGGRVQVRVVVHNDGEFRSKPTVMRLESAPLGAFVPWQPLARLPVPPIEPGGSREVSITVKRPRPATLGDFDRVPPRRLLTAVTAPDESSRPDQGFLAMLNLLRGRSGNLADTTGLAPDLMDLVGRGQPHWAGNINVFVNTTPVERHVAKSLRVYPGRTNLAMFVVGRHGRSDDYAFELAGLAPNWQAALFNFTNRQTLVVNPSSDQPISEAHWIKAAGSLLVMLAVCPPAGCGEGNLEVRVTRRSSQKTAVIEFSLDPAAQGTGCYAVES